MKSDFKLIFTMTIIFLVLGFFFLITKDISIDGLKGPFYEKPNEFYLTYFDSEIKSNQEVCFSYYIKSFGDKNFTVEVLIDNKSIERKTRISNSEYLECIESEDGMHAVKLITEDMSRTKNNKYELLFYFDKIDSFSNYTDESKWAEIIEEQKKITTVLHNDADKKSVFLFEFSAESEFVEINPFGTLTIEKPRPVMDAVMFVMGKKQHIFGDYFAFLSPSLLLGLVLFFAVGFVKKGKLDTEKFTKSLFISIILFIFITLIADMFFVINQITMIVMCLITIALVFLWKRK